MLTSNYVLAETVTWLKYHGELNGALHLRQMVEAAESTKLLSVAWVTPQIHEAAWDLFEQFGDQSYSFCDCSSFILGREHNVNFVFGFDAHFRTQGFDLQPHG